MPDGEFFSRDTGYRFSEKDSGITLTQDNDNGYILDVAFIKAGERDQVFTLQEFEDLERKPNDTLILFEISQTELNRARAYLDKSIRLDENRMLEQHVGDEFSL